MATLFQTSATRQPFAPINGSRLQSLTSLKNRQNALPITLTTPTKRKAVHDASYSDDENIDPAHFASPGKRSKGQDGSDIFKPSQFILTKAPASPTDFSSLSPQHRSSQSQPLNLSRPMLQPRSPAPKLSLNAGVHSNLSAPAGRSPTRKRIGILSRRRTASTSTSTFGSRVDPPSFGTSAAAAPPFSLAAALSGSIPKARQAVAAPVSVSPDEVEVKKGWFFEIHEDTEEELQHNLMEHGACTLEISSDEEVAERRREERGKENVPPVDDISQTSGLVRTSQPDVMTGATVGCIGKSWRELRRQKMEQDAIEVDRSPLGEMAAEEFYASGVTAGDVILIADEEYREEEDVHKFEFTVEIDVAGEENDAEIELEMAELLEKSAAPARVLEPIEKAEEGWSVWESGSAKGDE